MYAAPQHAPGTGVTTRLCAFGVESLASVAFPAPLSKPFQCQSVCDLFDKFLIGFRWMFDSSIVS